MSSIVTSFGESSSFEPQARHHANPETAKHDHVVQFYANEESLYRAVTDFLDAGISAGEPLVVIATEQHTNEFRHRLRSLRVDVEQVLAEGQLSVLDARTTLERFMIGGAPDPVRFAEALGGVIEASKSYGSRTGHVRAYGEMVDVLWKDGHLEAALRLEELWNELAKAHSFSLFCAYSMGNFYRESHSALFDKICHAHSHIIPTEHVGVPGSRPGPRDTALLQQRALALEGEVRHRKALEATLREALVEQQRVRELLEAKGKELEEADRRKDEFLAMLAHELRNPLAPIATALQLLRLRSTKDEETSRPLEILSRQSQHLTKLVDDLLEVSRITSGKIRLEKKLIDASTVVQRAVEISRPLIDSRKHKLTVALPHETSWIDADATRLAQVLGNLLNNAAKYMDDAGHIWLTMEADGPDVIFRVRDNGIGIPQELLPKLFELFTQADTSLDRSQGGLGIGLTLVRGLVELHGGSVEGRSDGPGKGSEFLVRLPVQNGVVRMRDRDENLKPLAKTEPRRMVVVDDNFDAAESLAELLGISGHEVRVAYDGPSALEVVRAHAPDVVLLDIGLPRMDGYAVARELRAEHGDRLTLIALTGYGQEEDRRRTKDAGFDHHFVKPLDLHLLVEVVAGLPSRT